MISPSQGAGGTDSILKCSKFRHWRFVDGSRIFFDAKKQQLANCSAAQGLADSHHQTSTACLTGVQKRSHSDNLGYTCARHLVGMTPHSPFLFFEFLKRRDGLQC